MGTSQARNRLVALQMVVLALDDVIGCNGLPGGDEEAGEDAPASFEDLVKQYAKGRVDDTTLREVLDRPLRTLFDLSESDAR